MSATNRPQDDLLHEILLFSPQDVSKNLMLIHDRALYHSDGFEISREEIEGLYCIKIFSEIIGRFPDVNRLSDLIAATGGTVPH